MAIPIENKTTRVHTHRETANTPASIGRLSSGLRVDASHRDVAVLATDDRLKTQVRAMKQAQRNAGDAIGLLQTAEGAMSELARVLEQMQELARRARENSLSPLERVTLEDQRKELATEVARIARGAATGGIDLLRHEMEHSPIFHDETSGQANARLSSALANMQSNVLQGSVSVQEANLETSEGAERAHYLLSHVRKDVGGARRTIGKVKSRLLRTMANLATASENLDAATSQIRDAQLAEETASRTQGTILTQGRASVLAQANQPQQVAFALLT